jgi:hypothetical protein
MKKLIFIILFVIFTVNGCVDNNYSYPSYDTPKTSIRTEAPKTGYDNTSSGISATSSNVIIVPSTTPSTTPSTMIPKSTIIYDEVDEEYPGVIYCFPTYTYCNACHHYHCGNCYYGCVGYIFCESCHCWHSEHFCHERREIRITNREIREMERNHHEFRGHRELIRNQERRERRESHENHEQRQQQSQQRSQPSQQQMRPSQQHSLDHKRHHGK